MNNLKNLRKAKGLTQKEVAQFIGISQNNYSYWENGKVKIDNDSLSKLAKFYDVTVDYLLNLDNINVKKGIKIPVLGSIPAGIPLEAIQDIVDYEEIPEALARSGEFFALKVKGDSMAPTILNGDIVIVRKQEDADSGSICVVMINGYDATLKEIKKELGGIWILPRNPNSNFKPTFYSNEEIESLPIRILGVAIEIRRTL